MKAKRIQVGRGRALALAVMVAIGTAMTLLNSSIIGDSILPPWPW